MTLPPPRFTKEAEPFIPYVAEAKVVEMLGPVVTPYMKRMGFLPNALKLYAHRPEIAETLFKLNSNIMRDASQTVDQQFKRKLAAIACKINGCSYCTAHSCAMLRAPKTAASEGWGLNDDDVLHLLDGEYEPQDDFEAVCIEYVRTASATPTEVPDELLARMKKLMSPAQIVEVACLVGFWKFYNTVHDSLHIPLEQHLLPDSGWVDV